MRKFLIPTLVGLTLLVAASLAGASGPTYRVTVTNITKGQTFTPILVTTHSRDVSLFELGSPASSELEILAGGGNTDPLSDALIVLDGDVSVVAAMLWRAPLRPDALEGLTAMS
jgi:hypothetical protein